MDLIFSIEQWADWMRELGFLAILISLLLSVLISILGVIPPFFLTAINSVVFGLWPGFLISLLGEVIGVAISYWIYGRVIGALEWTRMAERFPRIKPRQWRWIMMLQGASRKRQALLLLMGFLTPFMPSPLVTFAASAARAKYVDFLIVAIIGKTPSIAMETLIGHDVLLFSDNWSRLIVTVVMLIAMILILRKTAAKVNDEPID